jgi:hypothetical protein
MTTAISTKTKAERELESIEQEINAEAFEAFYHIGQKLLDIKVNRRYEAAGYKSWSAYCASGRIDYTKSQSDIYIRSSELRPKLGTNNPHEWTVTQLRELCKCETDNDAKRVATKAIKLANKQGVSVTAKLIAQVRDGSDETGKADEKRNADLQAASFETHLTKLGDILDKWLFSFQQVGPEQLDTVPNEVLIRVKNSLAGLTKFVGSKK